MASDLIINLTADNFESEIANATTPVVVDFWAEWCGPCRMLTPILEQVAESKGPAVKIGKVNVDDQPALAEQFQVRSIPMLVYFKNGKAVESSVGVIGKDALIQKIDALS